MKCMRLKKFFILAILIAFVIFAFKARYVHTNSWNSLNKRELEMRKKTVKALVVFILLIIPISLFLIGYIKNVYLKKEYVEMC